MNGSMFNQGDSMIISSNINKVLLACILWSLRLDAGRDKSALYIKPTTLTNARVKLHQ